MNLTVQGQKLEAGQTLWDRGSQKSVKGLHLRVFESKAVFYLYYRTLSGLQRKPKIGEYPTLSLENAREVAKAMLLEVAKGNDPSLDRQRKRTEMTVAELYQEVWAGWWSQKRFQESRHAKEVHQLWSKNLEPAFGRVKLSDLTASTLREWHKGFASKPYAGNRSLEVLSKMFSYAEEMEWREQSTNPCRLVKAHQEQKRDRYATDEEICKVAEILEREAIANPNGAAFLYLLIFTGSRPSAIERAATSDLQLRHAPEATFGVLTIQGKSGREAVFLPPQAVAALERCQRVEGDERLVPCNMPKKLWAKIRSEAGCGDLWARDWRRTFATVGMSEGFEMDVISELLNHKSVQTTKIYAKLKDSARRKVASKTADKMEKLMRGEK